MSLIIKMNSYFFASVCYMFAFILFYSLLYIHIIVICSFFTTNTKIKNKN